MQNQGCGTSCRSFEQKGERRSARKGRRCAVPKQTEQRCLHGVGQLDGRAALGKSKARPSSTPPLVPARSKRPHLDPDARHTRPFLAATQALSRACQRRVSARCDLEYAAPVRCELVRVSRWLASVKAGLQRLGACRAEEGMTTGRRGVRLRVGTVPETRLESPSSALVAYRQRAYCLGKTSAKCPLYLGKSKAFFDRYDTCHMGNYNQTWPTSLALEGKK